MGYVEDVEQTDSRRKSKCEDDLCVCMLHYNIVYFWLSLW